ncbi:HNH endonuclease [Vulgatibacter incomptus]|uniref:HNH endonuclease n=1 Tax=Vulgatibacter incomptus TaxID=1391653 RepID=UPI0012FC2F40
MKPKFGRPIGTLSGEDIERFWAKVDIRSDDLCWEWKASRNIDDYGQFSLGGKPRRANRVAWSIAYHADIPTGLVFRHKCDNPPCCNPSHLEIGTTFDNTIDMTKRGRASHLRLLGADVLEIRRLYASSTMTQKEIANLFGVDQSTISNVTTGRRWRPLLEGPTP